MKSKHKDYQFASKYCKTSFKLCFLHLSTNISNSLIL